MKRLIFALTLLGLFCSTYAQEINRFINQDDLFGTRVFVENHGQFDNAVPGEKKVLYALDNGLEQVYFTPTGLVYKITRVYPLTEKELEAMERGDNTIKQRTKTLFVNMEWLGAGQAQVDAAEKQNHYMTYGSNEMNSMTFKKLIYRNIYPNIDIEYIIPGDKKYGIKYSFIVRPGGNPDDIKIFYGGDVRKIKPGNNGEMIIQTGLDDIVEHAPVSYNGNTNIASLFTEKENVIGFEFPKGYDNTKPLVIDPWVTVLTTLTTNEYAYDVDFDYNGNTYVYGGYNPFKVAMFNSLGVLQWTFGGTVASITPAWSSAPILSQASNFAVNKFNGKSYIGQGYVGNGNRVVRLDAAGNYDNFVNTPTQQFQEVWDMGFHCATNNVFVLGGGTYTNNSGATLDATTAAITLSTFQPTNNSIAQDVVSNAIDDQGKIFIIYASGITGLNNKMCLINSTFNGNIWTQPSTFNSFSEQGNKSQYQGAGSLSSNGFNCLAVNANYLYYYDGFNLSAYNKATGVLVAATTLTTTLKRQGGIAVDDCDNLYLGGYGNILSYHFNGSSFSALPSLSLGSAGPGTPYVYDIKMDKQTKILYVCGSNFVGNYQAANSLACPTATSLCFNNVPSSFALCAGGQVTVVVTNGSNLTNPSYSMQPGSYTNTTGTFVITPTASVVYTTYITGTNAGNVVVTQTNVANVTVYQTPTAAVTTTQSSCTSTVNGFNINLAFVPTSTSSPSYTVLWSPVPNNIFSPSQLTATGGIAPGVYTATIQTTNGCSTLINFSINPQPDPATFNVSPFGPYVVNCYNPNLAINYIPPSLNYTTTNGLYAPIIGSSAAFTSTMANGVYTVTAVHPTSGCTSTRTYVVTQNTLAPTSSITPPFQTITCSNVAVTDITAQITPSTNAQHIWLAPVGGSLTATGYSTNYTPGGPGTYTHIAVNLSNGCSVSKTFTVFANIGFPTFSVQCPQNFTLGCNTKSTTLLNITGGQTDPPGGNLNYAFLTPGSTNNPVYSPNPTGTCAAAGVWTLFTKDTQTGCVTKVQISVILNNQGPILDTLIVPSNVLDCDNPSVVLEGLSSTPQTAYNWLFPGNPGNFQSSTITVVTNTAAPNNSVIAVYTLVLTDNNNTCITSTTVPMKQNLYPPKPGISLSNPAITCLTNTITLTTQSGSGIPPGTFPTPKPVVAFIWRGPSPQTEQQLSSTYIGYMPGTYTLIVKDLTNGCTASTTAIVSDLRAYPDVNQPNGPNAFVLDCGLTAVTISPNITPDPAFTYTWVPPSNTIATGDVHKLAFSTSAAGNYFIMVTNTVNGCVSSGTVDVIDGTLTADFNPDPDFGYAPLPVKFNNRSHTTTDFEHLTTIWNFGNGITRTTNSVSISPEVTYSMPGQYTITAFVRKGDCIERADRVIKVEVPSKLEIPNIFSPNDDGVNDVFFLHAASLETIDIKIFDRWGHLVYSISSDKGNIAWDGKNQYGKEVAEGVYFYTLKAKGADGNEFEQKGNVTVVR